MAGNADDRGSTLSSDWDGGSLKAECSPNTVMVGVSVYTDYDPDPARRGRPRKILCCGQ